KHPMGCGRVDVHARQDLEANPALLEVLDDLHQVLHAAPYAFELPHHQDIASATGPQSCGQLRTRGTSAGSMLFIDVDAPGLAERIPLHVQSLIVSGDACVSNTCHQQPLSSMCA